MSFVNELVITTLHARFQDFPYISHAPGLEMKLVHAQPEQNVTVLQMRAQPFAKSGLHRHLAPTYGFTLQGAWSHDPRKFPYGSASYICEPNELHRFHNGPEVSEVYYISTGDSEWFDDEGRELIRRGNAKTTLKTYLEKCEEAGLPRPNVLR